MTLIVNNTTIDNIIVRDRASGVETPLDLFQDSNGVEIWSGFKKYGQLIDRSITSVVAEDLDGATTIGKYAFANCVNLSSVILPNSITTIGDYAFYNDYNLANVTLPSTLTSIGSSAFDGCDISGELTLPSTLTSIGSSAFRYNNLTSINIPSSVTVLSNGTFANNPITEATIPSSVTSIDVGTFGNGGQVGATYYLNKLKMLPTTPPTLTNSSTVPLKFPTSVTIEVPSASLSAYQSADGWSKYASQMVGV